MVLHGGNMEHRCGRCFLRRELCLCAEIPNVDTQTRVVVIMAWKEYWSTTNTGRFAVLALKNSELRLRGRKAEPFDAGALWDPKSIPLFLYPSPDARELTTDLVKELRGPFTLIVPDGTWRQARKVGKREEALHGIPWVKLAPKAASRYRLRKPPQSHCLSTLESTAAALEVIEGRAVSQPLMALFEEMVARTLSTRSPDRNPQTSRRRPVRVEEGTESIPRPRARASVPRSD